MRVYVVSAAARQRLEQMVVRAPGSKGREPSQDHLLYLPLAALPKNLHHRLLCNSSLCLAVLPGAHDGSSHQDRPGESIGWALASRRVSGICRYLVSAASQKPLAVEHSCKSQGMSPICKRVLPPGTLGEQVGGGQGEIKAQWE